MEPETSSNVDKLSRKLLRHGFVVFLLGLVSGMLALTNTSLFALPRMALSSHLVGVTNGMFLLLVGLLFARLRLSPRLMSLAYFTVIYGAYTNWLGSMLCAVWGAHDMTIAKEGPGALPWQEAVVSLLLSTSGLVTMLACVILLYGLRPTFERAPGAPVAKPWASRRQKKRDDQVR